MGVPDEGFAIFQSEVERRGGTAERIAGREAVVRVHDRLGTEHRIRLKTKKAGDWQDKKSSRFGRPLDNRIDAWVFVDIMQSPKDIRIVESEWMRLDIGTEVQAWLSQDPTRDATQNTHHRIPESKVSEWQGRWDLIGLSDDEIPLARLDGSKLGAWMFKCNPKTWDLESYLADGNTRIDDWSVANNYRADMVRDGQKALLWVSGSEGEPLPRGIWGHGWTSGVRYPVANPPAGYWLDQVRQLDVQWLVPTNLQILESPVLNAELRALKGLAELEVFRQPQGSNPSWVSPAQLALIENLLPPWPARIRPVGKPITVGERGAGFGDPATNRIIELAAVQVVSDYYATELSCEVTDVGSQKLGWDLSCVRPDGTLYRVEVKGVAGRKPSVLLTRNEFRSACEDDNWELAVVTDVFGNQKLSIYGPEDVLKVAESFVYRADLTDG